MNLVSQLAAPSLGVVLLGDAGELLRLLLLLALLLRCCCWWCLI
jgi:hypothetical protein